MKILQNQAFQNFIRIFIPIGIFLLGVTIFNKNDQHQNVKQFHKECSIHCLISNGYTGLHLVLHPTLTFGFECHNFSLVHTLGNRRCQAKQEQVETHLPNGQMLLSVRIDITQARKVLKPFKDPPHVLNMRFPFFSSTPE